MKSTLYVVYSVMIKGNLGVGRMTVLVDANMPINFSNIRRIEEICLESVKGGHPTAKNLLLTDWKFIEPDVNVTAEGEEK